MRKNAQHIALLSTLIVVVLFCTSFLLQAPSSTFKDSNAKIKAIYIYNFSINTNWPANMKQGTFKIGIYGSYPTLADNFKKLAQTKKVGQQSIETNIYTSLSDIKDCHILYIDTDKSSEFDKITAKMNGKSTLVLSDKEGFGKKGACINFYSADNKQKFEINKNQFDKHNLQVSSKLLDLADAVY